MRAIGRLRATPASRRDPAAEMRVLIESRFRKQADCTPELCHQAIDYTGHGRALVHRRREDRTMMLGRFDRCLMIWQHRNESAALRQPNDWLHETCSRRGRQAAVGGDSFHEHLAPLCLFSPLGARRTGALWRNESTRQGQLGERRCSWPSGMATFGRCEAARGGAGPSVSSQGEDGSECVVAEAVLACRGRWVLVEGSWGVTTADAMMPCRMAAQPPADPPGRSVTMADRVCLAPP